MGECRLHDRSHPSRIPVRSAPSPAILRAGFRLCSSRRLACAPIRVPGRPLPLATAKGDSAKRVDPRHARHGPGSRRRSRRPLRRAESHATPSPRAAFASPQPPAAADLTINLLRADSPQARQLLSDNHLAFDAPMHDEGYILLSHKSPSGGETVDIIGQTSAGVFYGAQTLKQLIESSPTGPQIWTATIRDWPSMKYRGEHDDLSRGPFPTLAFQKHQLEVFAAHKVNLYSPYFESNLEYSADPLAAPPGGSLTRAEAKELVAFATPSPHHDRSRAGSLRPRPPRPRSTRSTPTSPRRRTATSSPPASPHRFRSSSAGSPRSPPTSPAPSCTSAPTKPSTSAPAAPSPTSPSAASAPSMPTSSAPSTPRSLRSIAASSSGATSATPTPPPSPASPRT